MIVSHNEYEIYIYNKIWNKFISNNGKEILDILYVNGRLTICYKCNKDLIILDKEYIQKIHIN